MPPPTVFYLLELVNVHDGGEEQADEPCAVGIVVDDLDILDLDHANAVELRGRWSVRKNLARGLWTYVLDHVQEEPRAQASVATNRAVLDDVIGGVGRLEDSIEVLERLAQSEHCTRG